jgi:hypothetical protein
MGVISFKKPDIPESYLKGKARCSVCKHEYQAKAPVGSTWLNCPSCGLDKAQYIYDVVPIEDTSECACGCDVFRVSAKAVHCIHCGKRQTF